MQSEPLFKDRNRFEEMADPLLEGKYPMKGLYQALAVAAMCLQEDASNRPVISDVVTALEHLAAPNDAGAQKEETAAVPRSLSTSPGSDRGGRESVSSLRYRDQENMERM